MPNLAVGTKLLCRDHLVELVRVEGEPHEVIMVCPEDGCESQWYFADLGTIDPAGFGETST